MILPDEMSQEAQNRALDFDETKQPQLWHRIALGAILLISAFLNVFQLNQEGYANLYYAATVKSMLVNFHNFWYVSFDPGGFVSLDKPPVGFWIQAASAKIFGFSGLSILLPEAIAGVLSVLLLFHLVRRNFGPVAGLIAALALAISPISVVTNRNNTIDSLLVLTLLLGAWTLALAAEKGRLRWLLLTAVIVGVGFNIKMLEAYLVVPAFGLMYLSGAPLSWKKRLLHLSLAAIVLVVVSFSWIMAVDLTPASQRPYVGSSQTNSEMELALGYNGIERLLGINRGGSAAPNTSSPSRPVASLGPGGQSENGNAGPLRLFNTQLGGQISWLLPLAILGLLAAAWQERMRLPLSRKQQALVLWGIWLITMGVFFSVAGFFHQYYLSMLAPAICALVGIGLVSMWNDYRRGDWRKWLLPFALLATAAAQVWILSAYADWSSWLSPIIVGFCSVAAAAQVVALLLQHWRINTAPVIAVGTLALLLAPTTWSAFSVWQGTSITLPTAGPAPTTDVLAFNRIFNGAGRANSDGFNADTSNTQLIRYLEANQGNTTYLLATMNATTAEPIILETGKAVMALGGFNGSDPILRVQQLQTLIRNGTVRYFLLLGNFGGQNGDLMQWVISHCATVSTSLWSSSSTSPSSGGQGFPPSGGRGGQQLFDCASQN